MTSISPSVARAVLRLARPASLAAMALLLAGCAGFNTNPRDPLEPMNRHVTTFNEGVDSLVLKPAATAYKQAVPPLVRTGVANFFGNLSDAWSFVNSALQFKFQNAAENFMRLNVNTVFGLGGILDVASELNIERHREDFGQTLGRWGVPAGPYIVLPLLGPSTLRDTVALPIDRKADPLSYFSPVDVRNSLTVLRAVDIRANLLRVGGVIDEAALDKYSFTREAYLQKRRAEIIETKDSDGAEPKADGTPAPVSAPMPAPAASAPTPAEPAGPQSAEPPGQPASAPAR
ncbi:VacJ family lipoprotein [Ramlibacter sp. WS9]|uniref:MlaA family lipoprotein n=1 Tax=Ramlibacter sp. WS9 TaxID=1882741 RepID=UPI0011420DAE|nr:VacJ family lipoprotein [Ramlibacter sp. WS9]